MKKFLISACLLLVAVSAVRAQAQLVSGPTTIIGRIGNTNLPLGAQLYDNAGTPKLAVDFGARYLYRSDGIGVAFDWDSGHLTASVYGDIYSDDNFSSVCISTEVRQLIANDGSSVSLDWSDPSILTIAGVIPISSHGILDGNLADNIKVLDRQLIANDGSTVALDWSGPTSVAFFTDVIVMGNDGNLSASAVSASTFTGDGSALSGVTPAVGSIGSVIAGTKTATGTATTTFTVAIGVTMANTTYKVTTEGDNALSAAVHYVNNKTTTSFDIVYLAGLTGSVAIDWIVSP